MYALSSHVVPSRTSIYAGTSVSVGALAADREALAVTKAAVAADVHKALDVLVALTAEVALNHDLILIDIIADGVNLILGEVLNARIHVNIALDANLRRSGAADAVNVGQTDLNALLTREVDTINTGQRSLLS